MKSILFIILLLEFIDTQAQSDSKGKPLESALTNNDSISAKAPVKNNLIQANDINRNHISTRAIKFKDSIYIFRGDTLLLRRSIHSPTHRLEEQVPVESALTAAEHVVTDSSKATNTKNSNPRKP
jgi:hypothetical protein